MNTTLLKRFGWLRFSVGLGALALLCGWTQWAGAATLTVDKPDYQPGETVTITGTGFGANDDVTVQVLHLLDIFDNNSSAAHLPWHVTAGANGGFVTSWVVPFGEDEEGVTLQATATGSPSGLSAIVIFTDAAAIPGLAPVNPPIGGFRIEGDLQANTPTTGEGDWVPGAGSGGNVLTAAGAPVDPGMTFHLIDLYNSGTDDNFAGGDKVDDNPSTWAWTRNPVGDKVDINNALLHITTDSNNHQWAVFSGDRRSDNGDAYIDFEFLQKTVTITTNGANTGGGFVTAGLDGGRTVGDFILTVALTRGGTTAGFFIEKWKAKTGGGFDYFDVDISTLPANAVFAAVNTSNGTPVPYGAFGNTTYLKNTFAEAAIDLTALITSAFDPCTGIAIKTVLVKTKESQSPSANIVDLITPIQVSLTIGPADAGQDQSKCADPSGTTSFSIIGEAHPGLNAIASMTWSVVGGAATVSPTSCSSCTSLPATANVTTSPATLRLTVVDTAGCSKSDDVILTAKPLPTCSITGETLLFAGTMGVTYTAPAGMTSYAWTISGSDSAFVTDISGTTSQTLTFNIAANATAGSLDIGLTIVSNGCSSTCSQPVDIQPIEEGCLVRGPTMACAGATETYNLTAPSSATSITWSLTPNATGAAFTAPPGPLATTASVGTSSSGSGSYTVSASVVYPGGTISCSRTTTLIPLPTCSISGSDGPLCPNSTGNMYSGPDGVDSWAWTITGNGTFADGGTTASTKDVLVTAGSACGQSFTLTLTVTKNGCSSTCMKVVSVNDTTNPQINCPAGFSVQCAGDVPVAYATLAAFQAAGGTASDNCDQSLSFSLVSDSGLVGGSCGGKVTRVYRVTDDCNNHADCTQEITVNDTTNPQINCPAGFSVQCAGDVPVAYATLAAFRAAGGTASDNCDQNLSFSLVSDSGLVGGSCGGKVTRVYRVTDDCNNHADCTQEITVNDTTNPQINCPAGFSVQCAGDVPVAYATLAAFQAAGGTASDNCDQSLSFSLVSDSGLVGGSCGGKVTRVYRVTDDCNNHADCTQEITVNDTTNPQINCPAGFSVQCAGDVPVAYATLAAFRAAGGTASDNCDQNLSFSLVTDSGLVGGSCGGKVTRVYRVTDDCNNHADCTQEITVNDTTNPQINCPAGFSVQCAGDVPVAYATLAAFQAAGGTASDNCDQNLSFSLVSDSGLVGGSCGGKVTRVYRVTDDCNNHADCTQEITVNDTTNPQINCPAGFSVQCAGDVPVAYATLAAFRAAGGTASDNCDQSLSFSLVSDSGLVGGSCGGKVTRVYRVTDDCNNHADCTQEITVNDTTNPQINCPAGFSVQCAGDVPVAYATLAAFRAAGGTASDNCDQSLSFSLVSDSGLVGGSCGGKVTRVYRVTDDCNNHADCTQEITVNDTTNPQINCPAGFSVQCAGDVPVAYATLAAFRAAGGTASDNCDQSLSFSLVSDSGLVGGSCGGKVTRVYRVTDDCNNHADCTQEITVNDTTNPQINCPAGFSVQCAGDVPVAYATLAAFRAAGGTASDNCDQNLSFSLVSDSGLVGGSCGGKVTRVYRVTDDCNNHADCTQEITVNDTTRPNISCPAPVAVECDADIPPHASNLDEFVAQGGSASDNCSAVSVVWISDVPAGTCPKVITRTYRAIDACYNAKDCTQKITVDDNTPPVFDSEPAAKLCVNSGSSCPDHPDPAQTGRPTAHDTCSTANISYSDSSVGTCPKTITRTWTATDACGNTATCVQIITCCCTPSLITDTMRCTLLPTSCSANNSFRLLFTPDVSTPGCYKLNASNPGQYYYNAFASGTPGSSMTFNVTLPYPFVTQGANPIEGYDGVTSTTSGGQTCLVPGNKFLAGSQKVVLTDYSPQAVGSTKTLTITVTVPPSGNVFLAIHLDYGLKGSTGYNKGGAGNDAILCNTTTVVIPDLTTYNFSVGGSATDSTSALSCNAFKKNPGVGGGYQSTVTTYGIPGAGVALKDAKGGVLATGTTDQDGWYMLPYKWTGKAATLYVTLTAPGKPAQTKSITLKANGYVQLDFSSP